MIIQADKARWHEDADGFWLAVRTKDRAAAITVAEQIKDKSWSVTLTQQKKKRSLDANAYAWVLLDKLAAVLNRQKTEVYRQYIREVGGNSETVCVVNKAVEKLRSGWERNGLGWLTDTVPSKLDGCTNVILYYGSSEYDTAQMSRFINMIVEDCKVQGIETLTPAELARLTEEWK